MCCALTATAQNDLSVTYEKARDNYEMGHFLECYAILSDNRNIKNLDLNQKINAYRILVLSCINMDNISEAEKYASELLAVDPYYNSYNDDPRFIEIIARIKSAQAGITTASRQSESLEESPVPVTLITESMIRHSGAQTLQELLCLYVPGMSLAEGLENNIAMHGISGLSQEKILFLQDGHRLNGFSTNAESPDYRNSLDKIQQIEVLRGPASSLYGNVALTAVVNIITRKGAMINGGRVSGTIGTNDTYGTTFSAGGGNNAVDIMGWGSIQSTGGFKYTFDNPAYTPTNQAHLTPKSTVYAHAFNRRPSYDVGVKGRWRDFSLLFNSQRSKQTPYLNILQMPATQSIVFDQQGNPNVVPAVPTYDAVSNYNYDRYCNVRGNGPGVTRTNHHLNLDYSHSFGAIELQASAFASIEMTDLYNVMGDSVDFNVGASLLNTLQNGANSTDMSPEMMNMLMSYYVKTAGAYQVMEWESLTFGGQAQMLFKYNFLGRGNAMAGCQYEHFMLTDGMLYLGGDYSSQQMVSSGEMYSNATENVYSLYAQVKHFFTDRFIFNGGLRLDKKFRFNDDNITSVSPRFSLIYKFNKDFSARASYNYSFVDAPYIYRASGVKMFSGGASMRPETMKSFQAGVTFHRPNSGLLAEISSYCNKVSDLVSVQTGGEYLFVNAGEVTQAGVEAAVQYVSDDFFVNANATWQRFITSSGYTAYAHNPLGVPQLMGNATIAYSPWQMKGEGFFSGGKLWLRGTVNAQSNTYYNRADILLSSALQGVVGDITKVSPQVVLGFGIGYEWRYLDLDFTMQNITNNDYKVGSILADGIPRRGRQILGKVTVKF